MSNETDAARKLHLIAYRTSVLRHLSCQSAASVADDWKTSGGCVRPPTRPPRINAIYAEISSAVARAGTPSARRTRDDVCRPRYMPLLARRPVSWCIVTRRRNYDRPTYVAYPNVVRFVPGPASVPSRPRSHLPVSGPNAAGNVTPGAAGWRRSAESCFRVCDDAGRTLICGSRRIEAWRERVDHGRATRRKPSNVRRLTSSTPHSLSHRRRRRVKT